MDSMNQEVKRSVTILYPHVLPNLYSCLSWIEHNLAKCTLNRMKVNVEHNVVSIHFLCRHCVDILLFQNNMRISKRWHNFHFWAYCPFKIPTMHTRKIWKYADVDFPVFPITPRLLTWLINIHNSSTENWIFWSEGERERQSMALWLY